MNQKYGDPNKELVECFQICIFKRYRFEFKITDGNKSLEKTGFDKFFALNEDLAFILTFMVN